MPLLRLNTNVVRDSPAPTASGNNTQTLPGVVTTTIYTGGTPAPAQAAPTSNSEPSSLPIASIAGGAAAGVFLAVAAVVVWIWWGRCLKRSYQKRTKEAVCFLLYLHFASLLNHVWQHMDITTRENTRRNASSSTHHIFRSPTAGSTPERTVRFMPSDISPPEKLGRGSHRHSNPVKASSPLRSVVPNTDSSSPRMSVDPSPSSPGGHARSDSSTPLIPTTQPPPPSNPSSEGNPGWSPWPKFSASSPGNSLAHKPSTVSSTSTYSQQSGEERQARTSGNGFLAALGHTLDPRRLSTLTGSTGSFYSTLEEPFVEPGPPQPPNVQSRGGEC
ncbi:hypothetical protein JAAARDRAFT_619239 [Jaapia argillacea MUCL 33604]|uniref:Uncharacterized protein n=1 Tax=Jaapia argillacea MUCL 33604 TaxID=933084 RepID=A0A067Q7C6_9AGAM|nr:hypothetical protein JAAARDRAFT_619239 [Jaapia argillacea MUCL 33604]